MVAIRVGSSNLDLDDFSKMSCRCYQNILISKLPFFIIYIKTNKFFFHYLNIEHFHQLTKFTWGVTIQCLRTHVVQR